MNEQILLELQKSILSNEALMSYMYKKYLGNTDSLGKAVKNLSLSIYTSKLSN